MNFIKVSSEKLFNDYDINNDNNNNSKMNFIKIYLENLFNDDDNNNNYNN